MFLKSVIKVCICVALFFTTRKYVSSKVGETSDMYGKVASTYNATLSPSS